MIDDRKPARRTGAPMELPHPVQKLLKDLPWLFGLPTVRLLFRVILELHADRLARSVEAGPLQPLTAAGIRSALIYFENTAGECLFEGVRLNLYHLYLESLLDIRCVTARVPWLEERSVDRLSETVAVLMHGLRYARD